MPSSLRGCSGSCGGRLPGSLRRTFGVALLDSLGDGVHLGLHGLIVGALVGEHLHGCGLGGLIGCKQFRDLGGCLIGCLLCSLGDGQMCGGRLAHYPGLVLQVRHQRLVVLQLQLHLGEPVHLGGVGVVQRRRPLDARAHVAGVRGIDEQHADRQHRGVLLMGGPHVDNGLGLLGGDALLAGRNRVLRQRQGLLRVEQFRGLLGVHLRCSVAFACSPGQHCPGVGQCCSGLGDLSGRGVQFDAVARDRGVRVGNLVLQCGLLIVQVIGGGRQHGLPERADEDQGGQAQRPPPATDRIGVSRDGSSIGQPSSHDHTPLFRRAGTYV